MAQPRFAVFVKPWKTLSIVEIGEKVKSLGFDFIELDGMQGSTGAGSAEVIDYLHKMVWFQIMVLIKS